MGELQDRINQTNSMTDLQRAEQVLLRGLIYQQEYFKNLMRRALAQIDDQDTKQRIEDAMGAYRTQDLTAPMQPPFSNSWWYAFETNNKVLRRLVDHLLLLLKNRS